LNLYTAYVFDDAIDSYYDANDYYAGTIEGGFQWGGGLEFMAQPNAGIELLYIRQGTTAPITYFQNGVRFTNFDLGVNYVMIGANQYIRKPGGMVEGFGGAMLGMGIFGLDNPDNGNHSSRTKFAWGFKAGANIWATEKVGIKLQAQLLSAVQSVGGGFYFGTGGAGAGVSSFSSMYQFSLGGGLVFKFGAGA
jgi:hypothetical protein